MQDQAEPELEVCDPSAHHASVNNNNSVNISNNAEQRAFYTRRNLIYSIPRKTEI